MSGKLDGRKALVTGAATGIGRAVVEALDIAPSTLDLEREAYVVRPEEYASFMPKAPLPEIPAEPMSRDCHG